MKTDDAPQAGGSRYAAMYDRYAFINAACLFTDVLKAPSRLRRLAALNRYRDYARLAKHPEWLPLHKRISEILMEGSQDWRHYDYGEGYFYQGLLKVGITGFRNTEERVSAMGLKSLLKGRRVLDIGCNSGFVSLSICETAAYVQGIDINPHLIQIASCVQYHLGIVNAGFDVSTFEDLEARHNYDAVLSLANHSTYDGQTRHSLAEYFEKCRDCLSPGGLLIFESHPPQLDDREKLGRTMELIGRRFEIEAFTVIAADSFLDRDRTFVLARAKA